MRLSLALPAAAAGLVAGWAAVALAADAPPPPAAPIFYCPSTPQKAATPAACKPAAAAAAQAPAPQAAAPQAEHAVPRPPARHVAMAEHRHWRHRYEHRYVERFEPRGDVSASQEFIYRYEHAQHGLDARAADEAWEHGPPPCREHGCPPPREIAEAPPPPRVIVEHAPPAPPQVIVARAPPPPQQVIIEREAPPPPQIVIEHPPAPPPQIVFERAPAPPPQVIYERAPACPDRCPTGGYGWQDRREGGGYGVQRYESERSSGWRYSEQDGRSRYQAWGDQPQHRRGGCPPQVVEEGGCAAAGGSAYAEGEGEWRDGSYGRVTPYSGRDAYGFLVWPGKRAP